MKKNLRTFRLYLAMLTTGLLYTMAAISQSVVTNPTSPWVVPAGVSQIKVEVWGGGGGGGGCNQVVGIAVGSGGGGGAYNSTIMTVSPGQSYTITRGTAGTAASDANGGPGGTSTVTGIGGTVSANGGGGGGRRGGAAGAGGTGGIFNGGAGGVGSTEILSSNAGGGGGGAGNAANGNNGATNAAGTGGAGFPNIAPYVGGIGGANRNGNGAGNPGVSPGGGGAGGYQSLFNGAKAGGVGGLGQVVITYCPTFTLNSTSAQTPKCAQPGTSIVTVTSANLPVGTYNVIYDRSSPAALSLAATLTVATANTGTFTVGGLTIPGPSTITISSIGNANNTFCTNSISANNTTTITVEEPATINAGSDQIVCDGLPIILSGTFGGSASMATWSGAGTFDPDPTFAEVIYFPTPAEIAAGTATVTYTTDNPAGDCGAVSDQVVITIRKAPTAVSITPASNSICVGTGIALTGNSTITSVSPPLTSENFNGTVTYAVAGTNTGGGIIFTKQNSGYVAGLTTITNSTAGASPFMIATVTAFGVANTNSTLTTPIINTVGYGNLSLTFNHSYTKGLEAGVSVQLSTNGGGSWFNINTSGVNLGLTNTYTGNQGANNNFVGATFNLNSYIGQANLRIRFNFVSNVNLGTSWWAIENVALNGNKLPLYAWSSDGPGLPGGAGALNTNNKNITALPTNSPTMYIVTVSDPYTNCTTSSDPVEITLIPDATIALTTLPGSEIQDVCPNVGIDAITYEVGGSATGAIATGLPTGVTGIFNAGIFTISGTPSIVGTYNYKVKTTGPCKQDSLLGTLVVNAPPLNSFIKTNVSVCHTNDGTITMTPTGVGPFSYAWSGVTGSGHPANTPYPNPGDVAAITGLPIGFYNCTVTDGNGCSTATMGIQVKFAFAPYVSNNGSISATCVNTGSIILYANAGVTPYTYSLDGINYQGSNTFTNLAPATYTGYVKDAANCVSTKEILIGTNGPIVVNPFVRNASSCAPDGSIEIYRTGGIPPYTYNLDGGPEQSTNKFFNLAAGSYVCNVTDSKGCTGTTTISVAQGIGLTVTANKANSSNCTTDGMIQAIVSGGVAPYTYSTDGINFQGSNVFTGLAAGSYTVTAKDIKGCLGTTNVTINLNPIIVSSFVVNATTCAGTGSIQIFRTGGVGPYMYSLDGNTYQASNLFSGLAPGAYDCFVKDSKTCTAIQSGVVVGPIDCGGRAIAARTTVAPGRNKQVHGLFDVQAFPNPSQESFRIQLQSDNSNDKVMIIVTDIAGRKVYQSTGSTRLQFEFGHNFGAGIYLLEVMQGDRRKTMKLVKE